VPYLSGMSRSNKHYQLCAVLLKVPLRVHHYVQQLERHSHYLDPGDHHGALTPNRQNPYSCSRLGNVHNGRMHSMVVGSLSSVQNAHTWSGMHACVYACMHASRYITLHYITYITLHCITLHYIHTYIDYITSHYITLHTHTYAACMHTHTYIRLTESIKQHLWTDGGEQTC
jgi:hypothetical protein